MSESQLRFEPIHIDVARHSTDDFNPFHDPLRWHAIPRNPFGAPIALGFQMEFLAADRVARRRLADGLDPSTADAELHFRNYSFRFVDALRAGDAFHVDVARTIDKTGAGGGLCNRVTLARSDGGRILLGTVSDSPSPKYLPDATISGLPSLERLPDRVAVAGTSYFLKRKFLNTSNAKNFALGALCRPQDYIDELEERVEFSPMFLSSLMSCALLEKARKAGHDFTAEPLVYTSHQISVDRRIQRELRSNDKLHILVEGPEHIAPSKGLGRAAIEQQHFRCYCVWHGSRILFRAKVQLAPLRAFAAADRQGDLGAPVPATAPAPVTPLDTARVSAKCR